MLNDLIGPYTGLTFNRFTITNTSKVPCHGEPTLRGVLESPLVVLVIGEVLTSTRFSDDCERLARIESDRRIRGKRCACALVLVRNASGGRNDDRSAIERRLHGRNQSTTLRSPLDDQSRPD